MLQVAYEAACQALPAHRHKSSPRKFTQPQLLACLVLKEFSRLDYRGLAAHLADHPELGRQVGLKGVPPSTNFQKAAARSSEPEYRENLATALNALGLLYHATGQ